MANRKKLTVKAQAREPQAISDEIVAVERKLRVSSGKLGLADRVKDIEARLVELRAELAAADGGN